MKQKTISASKLEKYFKFLNKCHEQMTHEPFGLESKDLYTLQRQHRVSANTIKVMKDGGLIKKDKNIYHWKTSKPTTGTARELFLRLKEVNKKYNEKNSLLKAKKVTPVQQSEAEIHDRDLLEQQFIDSMPKPKRKYKKRAKKEVSILWGMFTYKTYNNGRQ